MESQHLQASELDKRYMAVKKSDVIEIMRGMPEEIDFDKLIYALYVRRKIEIAEADAEAGRDISQEEFERLTDEWLK